MPDDIDESQLRISNYDSKGAWVPLSTTVDEVNNLITVQIDHFSDYTLSYVQRPEKIYDRTWFIQGSTVGEYRTEAHLGRAMALQGDYNGDGVTDFGGFNEFDGILGGRCNDEGMWFFRIGDSTTNECFGKGQTIPAPADYDGDNKTDLAVYEYSTGTWYFKDGSTEVFGDINVSVPVPADYDGDEERLKSLGYLGG